MTTMCTPAPLPSPSHITPSHPSLHIIVLVIIHFLPITIISYCYLNICVLVIWIRCRVKPDIHPKTKPLDSQNLLTMFMVFVLFAVCWSPLNFIGFAVGVKPSLGFLIPERLFTSSYFIAHFNSCLNVVIYGTMNQNYKRIMLTVFQLAYRTYGD